MSTDKSSAAIREFITKYVNDDNEPTFLSDPTALISEHYVAKEDVNQEVEKRIAERDELIVLLNAYATFLGKIIDKHATFLMVHGIKASDDEIKMGQKYRDDINRIISRLVSQKMEGGGE